MCTNKDLEDIFEASVHQFLAGLLDRRTQTKEIVWTIRKYFKRKFPKLKLRCRTWRLMPIKNTERVRFRLEVLDDEGTVRRTFFTHLIY